MLARHDGEKELFDAVDMEEDARLRDAGFLLPPKQGVAPSVQPVMVLAEVPEYVRAEAQPVSASDDSWGILKGEDGSTDTKVKRKRNEVCVAHTRKLQKFLFGQYSELLTPRQRFFFFYAVLGLTQTFSQNWSTHAWLRKERRRKTLRRLGGRKKHG